MNPLDLLKIAFAIPQLVDSVQQISPNENGAQKFSTVAGVIAPLLPPDQQAQTSQAMIALGAWTNAIVELYKNFGFPHQAQTPQ